MALCAACGSAPPRTEHHETVAHTDPPPLPSDRALAADATFGDLVAAATRQDDRRASDSDAGCLLRHTSSGFVLEADLSVAVRGLDAAASDLGARVETSAGRARVLTRLGGYGGPSPLVAVALTTTAGAPSRTGALLVQTAAGVYVLRTDVASAPAAMDLEAAAAAVRSMDVASVFVTADANVSLVDVARLLAALPSSLEGRVALAAVLPEDARAPEDAAPPPTTDSAICADGLPPLPDDAAVGDLDADAVRAGLSSLVPAGQACVATSASGLGGVVRVAFRIDATGHVGAACVREDATGDATLRACLVAALEALSFPAPSGAVDVELPLRLEVAHDAAHHQRALCTD